MELFEARRAIELLSAPFFVCRENVSRKTGSAGKDLTARELNQVVVKDKLSRMKLPSVTAWLHATFSFA